MSERVGHNSAALAEWTSLMEKWPSEDVLSAADAVSRLLGDPGWLAVQGLVQDLRERSMRRLTHGPTLDAPDYARAMGQLHGLSAQADAAVAVLSHAARVQDRLNRAERVEA